MGRPSSRKQIHERFSLLPQHANIAANEVLRTILVDSVNGKPCHVTPCADYPETSVYKGAFTSGLLGRAQTNVMGLKVATLRESVS